MKRKLFALFLVLAMIITASCAQRQPQRNQQPIAGVESSMYGTGDIERVKVTADRTNIRSGCSANSPSIGATSRDTRLDVVGQVENWFAVRTDDNRIGFIPKQQATPIVADDKKPSMGQTSAGAAPQTTAGGAAGTNIPKTPSANTNSGSLTNEEMQMVNLVNQARSQNGLTALQVDMQVENVARVKAQDMIDNNYFSHNSPKYGSPFEMLKSFGVHYVAAGENIAGNQTVQAAFNALMNSPGHRANILSKDFTHIGIGIKKGGPYGSMFAQMFISKPQ